MAASKNIGDLLLLFGRRADGLPTRSGAERFKIKSGLGWSLWGEPITNTWKGFPLVTASADEWDVWLLGELYGKNGREPAQILLDFLSTHQQYALLNGHFLLWAWKKTDRTWHVWIPRIASLHAYFSTSGNCTALGTFSPAVADVVSRKNLDYVGLASMLWYGYFLGDATHFSNVHVFQPATHYQFSENGHLIQQNRYWEWWHEPDYSRSYDDTLAEFATVIEDVVDEHIEGGRILTPLSGGLDSRTLVAAATRQGNCSYSRLFAYSYGFSDRSIETRISRDIAKARNLHFTPFTIHPYLFDQIGYITSVIEGGYDILHARQAAVVDELADMGDFLLSGHAQSWFNDRGLLSYQSKTLPEEQMASHLMVGIEGNIGPWLFEHLKIPEADEIKNAHRDIVRSKLRQLQHIREADFKSKAFRFDTWLFRSTTPGLRMFQAAAFLRLPLYDTRVADFFCTVPTENITGKRLQIDYLKRYAPDLAHIKWQELGTDLYKFERIKKLGVPKEITKRLFWPPLGNNWDVQFAGEYGRAGFQRWLFQPGLRLHEFVSPKDIQSLIKEYYTWKYRWRLGRTIGMLVTFSAWLEYYG